MEFQPLLCNGKVNMNKRKFWPLDFDPEGEIYENLAWDLPGYVHHRGDRPRTSKIPASKPQSQKKLR
jgi:hypothetical protein